MNDPVREHWDKASCGELLAIGESEGDRFASQRSSRYDLEPFIADFAKFSEGRGKRILEIGVGMGADHEQWALSQPLQLCGIDLTPRAINFTEDRLHLSGLESDLRVADAEELPFADASFDLVYSWGVLHHSSNTLEALREVARVTRPDGIARVMIYHKWSILGFMLWLRYGVPTGNLSDIYANYVESPGTKAFSREGATQLFRAAGLQIVSMRTELSPSDLLSDSSGQRHNGRLLSIAKKVWPRKALKICARRFGLYLMIEARRPL